jgi:hypothetical protein
LCGFNASSFLSRESILSLFVVSGFWVYNQEVLASFLTKKTAGTAIAFEDYSKMEKKRDRAVTLSKESPKNKSILWRQQFEYYGARSELNAKQKDFLGKLSEFLNEDFFELSNSLSDKGMSEAEFVKTEQGKPYGDLMKQVPELFTREQARQLFITVGDISTITEWGCEKASTEKRANGPNNSESSNSPLKTARVPQVFVISVHLITFAESVGYIPKPYVRQQRTDVVVLGHGNATLSVYRN